MSAYMAGRVIDAFTVTPHDSNTLSKVANALWIGGEGSGNLKVRLYPSGTIQAYTGITSGRQPIQCDIVYDADTDVTGIVGEVIG
jgi:hypothetical protein